MPYDDDFGPLKPPSMGMKPLVGVRSPSRRPLSDEERDTTSQSLLDRGKSGLSAVLGALDYPGSMVRGALGGKPGSRMTGKELLEQHGVIGRGDKGWGAWGLGLGADIVTDPLTYASFGATGALNKGGQALSKAGHLEGWGRKALLSGFHDTETGLRARGVAAPGISRLRDLGKRIATPEMETAYHAATGRALMPMSPLSGLARFSVPFAPKVGVTLGTGRVPQAIAGGLDKAADYMKFRLPGMKTANSMFDSRVLGATDEASQRAMVGATPYRKQMEAAAGAQHYDTTSGLDAIIRQHPQHEVNILRAGRISAEGTSPLAFLASAKDPAEHALFGDFLARTKPIGDAVAGYRRGQLAAEKVAGLRVGGVGDQYAREVGRQSSLPGSGTQRMFLDTPGGTDRLNDWVHRFAGNSDREAVADRLRAEMVADHAHVLGQPAGGVDLLKFADKAKKLSGWLGQLDADKYLGKIATAPFFGHDLAGDVLRAGQQHAREMTAARSSIQALGAGARPLASFGPGESHIPLPAALGKLGLGTRELRQHGGNIVGAGPELFRSLASKGAGPVEPLLQGGTPAVLNGQLGQWAIPRTQFESLAKSSAGWMAPEKAVAPIAGWDSATNTFKALTYPIWLASHVRNAATAAMNNMRTGTTIGDYWKQLKLMTGKLPGVEADAMRRAQYAHGGIFREGGQLAELAGQTSGALSPTSRKWSGYTPGTNQFGMSKAGPTGNLIGDTANLIGNEGGLQFGKDARDYIRSRGKTPNPFGLSGVGGRDRDVLAPVVAGRKLGSNIEDFMRGAQWNGLARQGYSPEMAARQIDKYHFDYSALAPFEKTWMRRAVPFYTFARKNLPLQLDTLATRPGAFSTPFKPTQVNRDQREYVPDYLSGGLVAPLGPEKDGQRRFLSGLGLPQEEAFKEMQLWNGKPDVSGGLMHLAGNLNPMIKAPLEALADRQFYTGRKLSDLRPSATASGLSGLVSDEYAGPLGQLISNTPLTRFAATADKLMDTQGVNSAGRKPGWATALNLATGARITDVDLERQRAADQRNALDRVLGRSPNISRFQSYYVRPENKPLMTENETLYMRKMVDLQQKAKEYMARQRLIQRP